MDSALLISVSDDFDILFDNFDEEPADILGMYFVIDCCQEISGEQLFDDGCCGKIVSKGNGFYLFRRYYMDPDYDDDVIRALKSLEVLPESFIINEGLNAGSHKRRMFFYRSRDDFINRCVELYENLMRRKEQIYC